MIQIFTTLIVVVGFTLIHYLHTKHVMRLELLLKARDAYEAKELYKQFEETKQEIISDIPATLQEAVANAEGPEDIRKMFGRDDSIADA